MCRKAVVKKITIIENTKADFICGKAELQMSYKIILKENHVAKYKFIKVYLWIITYTNIHTYFNLKKR